MSKHVNADFIGCNFIPKSWLIGFGLDDNNEKRGWIHLYVKNMDNEKRMEFRNKFAEYCKTIEICDD